MPGNRDEFNDFIRAHPGEAPYKRTKRQKSDQVLVTIPRRLLKELDEAALRLGENRSATIRLAVRQWLVAEGRYSRREEETPNA